MGNIPAHAGKTVSNRPAASSVSEHPRARGENGLFQTQHVGRSGTSPRTRGKQLRAAETKVRTRNIPAHAGKTRKIRSKRPLCGEHPRARGENTTGITPVIVCSGTSPRTRGKHGAVGGGPLGGRNIPAHAGKTPIDVRFLVPEGHFTFDFVFLHRGGSMESPCSSLLSECFSARIVVYGQLGTSLLSAYGCAFWWDGG